ncbi:MAG: L,D-transpeptidase family protein [Pseudooceanicola sp.]|nr:L,D-transpeptidase family protein [Pseudooceanicola sp.]
MKRRTFGLGMLATLALSACASKFRTYRGPEVTGIVVNKSTASMHLLHHREVLKSYKIDLGFAPAGPKQFEGDGKTPEGTYLINRRNPNSAFHLSLGISYPNQQDVEYARSQGKRPGGDIFIHGQPNDNKKLSRKPNWTAGCIAVKNREIEDIYAMVRDGTVITIYA